MLIAMPHLADPYFGRSVVLLCEHTKDGAMGIIVNERVPLASNPNKYNEKYIDTKIKKLGHLL